MQDLKFQLEGLKDLNTIKKYTGSYFWNTLINLRDIAMLCVGWKISKLMLPTQWFLLQNLILLIQNIHLWNSITNLAKNYATIGEKDRILHIKQRGHKKLKHLHGSLNTTNYLN